MVLTADKERVRTLLKDTITLLCRNGLNFKHKFSIEALIGVTLDDDDIFLISINDLIRTELGIGQEAEADAEMARNSDDESRNEVCFDTEKPQVFRTENGQKPRKRKRKPTKTTSIKEEPGISDFSDECEAYDEIDAKKIYNETEATQMYNEMEAKQIKTYASEHGDEADSQIHVPEDSNQSIAEGSVRNENSPDLVYIKEEMDSWSENLSNDQMDQPDYSFNGSSQGNMPMPGMWQQMQHNRSFPGASRSSTVTSAANSSMVDESCLQQPSQFYDQLKCRMQACDAVFSSRHELELHMREHRDKSYIYNCQYCEKRFNSTGNLRGHMSVHTGMKEYVCPYCSKEFAYKNNLMAHIRRCHPNISANQSYPQFPSPGGSSVLGNMPTALSFALQSGSHESASPSHGNDND